MRIRTVSCMVLTLGLCAPAFAGTTTIDFTEGMGNLVSIGGALSIDANCYAVFDGPTTYLIGDGGVPASSAGETSITMWVTPYQYISDDNSRIGLILRNASSTGLWVMATVDNMGNIILRRSDNHTVTPQQAMYPNTPGTTLILSYYPNSDEARVDVGGMQLNVTMTNALGGASAVEVGVVGLLQPQGSGKFSKLSATGAGIPDLDSTGVCGPAEGEAEGEVEVEGEGEEEGEVEGEVEGEGEEEGEAPPTAVSISGNSLVEEGAYVILSATTPDLVGMVVVEWYKNHQLIIDAVDMEYHIPSATIDDTGWYVVVVTDESKAVYTSAPFMLRVVAEGSMPAGSLFGLGALVLLLSGASLCAVRRNHKK